MTAPVKAWWFAAKRSLPHGDGRRIRVGGAHLHRGLLVMCERGFHASRKILGALNYAPGSLLCRVECSGEIIEERDKLVCTRRKYLAVVEANEMLRRFARLCALDVSHLWDPPDTVMKYLRTGDEDLRAAARDAAGAAARAAAGDAAGAAAWDAAWDAARAAARAAAWAAARDAAGAAAWAAARAAQNRRLHRMALALIRKGKTS